ncbi:N-acetylmuramoyl-L-alanine amidase, partial [Neobacillus drentensis]|uniref:N-acetylmuramoyl-L-alanine amidase n=1 Tax=Neobacillus drentensis TaxID=220684 RepID=UPI002FFE83C4
IYYRVHTQDFGWLGWAKNGMKAGSEGLSKRLEAIEIKLVPKGQGEPVNKSTAFKQPLTVFLDPGHGGSDPGAIVGVYHEADLNFAVAKKVKALLVNRGYRVIMSRNTDTTVELLDRPRMANDLAADIFVSIHTNSTGEGVTSAAGIEGYYYEYNPKYPPIFNSAMHNNPERISKSMTLANLIQGNMVGYTGAKNRGTDGASFAVIRETAMPATLVEIGFINNASERQKLFIDSYQNKLAQALADGIVEYFKIY